MLAVEAEGAQDHDDRRRGRRRHLHPIQQCFLEDAALQCGICTPGFIMSAKALLDSNPNPSEHEIRFQLAGNLCRCTGYDKIVRAVQDAAKALAAGKHAGGIDRQRRRAAKAQRNHGKRESNRHGNSTGDNKKYKVIGTRPIRHDGADKVTGRAIYGADVQLAGMVHGKMLRSPHAHAQDQVDRHLGGREAARACWPWSRRPTCRT